MHPARQLNRRADEACATRERILAPLAPVVWTGRAAPALTARRLRTPVETAFGCPRDFLDNRFVYVVISPRARGLSVGINMNPDKRCNFDCRYCEVDRGQAPREARLEVEVMAEELQRTLEAVWAGRLRERPCYCGLPEELTRLRHVTLSGDGEPTLCPNFVDAVQAVLQVRALGPFPFFKIVLITNATGLDRPQVQEGLSFFTQHDEVWAKLDAGTEAYMARVNRSGVPLDQVLANILMLARQRPVVIQSLFPAINGEGPAQTEIDEYTRRLRDLVSQGARIPLVQVYSATRPTPHSECGHLPLRTLSRIADTVRRAAGLRVELF